MLEGLIMERSEGIAPAKRPFSQQERFLAANKSVYANLHSSACPF
jgi:hypothetical protein